MKNFFLKILGLVFFFLLSSCGGGGGDAGDSLEFSVLPPSVIYKAAKGDVNCARMGGLVTVFSVNGGQPPFRVVNSHPDFFYVDKTEASGKDPQFKVTLIGGCGEDLGVVVLDAFSRSSTVAITIEKGDDED